MFSLAQRAIVKKDMRELFINKQAAIALAVVPVMFTVIMPVILGVTAGMMTFDDLGEFGNIMSIVPKTLLGDDPGRMFFYYMTNMIFPMFFLLIPVMASGIMAANSFVGEKERGTLETLLFSSMTVRAVFTAKVTGCLLMALGIMFASFILFFIVVLILSFVFFGGKWMFGINWIFTLLLLGPAMTLIAETVTVLISARAKTFMEAQQVSALIIVPIIMLIAGQITGLLILGPVIICAISIISFATAIVLLYISAGRFQTEKLLK